jgi:hypothetical protein
MIQEKSKAVAELLPQEGVPHAVALDPLTILTLADLILKVVNAIYQCVHTTANAVRVAADPGVIQRLRLHWIVRRHLADHPVLAQHFTAVAATVEKAGKSVTADEMAALHAEAARTFNKDQAGE